MKQPTDNKNQQLLLKAGVLVGPLFIGASLILASLSTGFDFTKHEVSLLLIGNLGWLQILNFVITGLLGITCAIGLRRALKSGRASKWGPILMAVFGGMFLVAAVFHPDGHHGFPAGAPAGMLTPPTAHGGFHSMAFSLLALAVIINGFVFARRYFADHRAWAVYSAANSVLIVVLFMLSGALMPSGRAGLELLGVALTITVWVSAVALRVLKDARRV